ncbi:ABC transporter permease [Hyperthermus butylicus]|uniref:ABC-type iron(III) transport system, permease component n=1 Tax=Hyperthermus butylicus (strain DSM 5456 / JCM 9403 / PLM1-5) TaxID=415426 RepID=A2BJN6_HYPBU|nr:iron ABC transporter permease [Hyperthermus butylicus]ABM80197.1 ABC-type iron(III) transport system, permease component [Hyperthermus butylicus DSM 5456]
MAQHSWGLAWNPLGRLWWLLALAAWLTVAVYTAPIFISLAYSWPPRWEPPFKLSWVLGWTLLQAALSASLAILAGWPLGVLAGFYRSRSARAAVVASLAPFMSPVVVVALGLRSLYGPGGLLGGSLPQLHFMAQGWTGVLALHSYFNIGLAAALTAAAAASVEKSVVEQSLLLGLHGPRLWLRLLIPATARAAIYAWAVAFLYSFASAGPLLVEGAAYRYYTLEAWLYTLYYGFPSLRGLAALLAVAELGLAALLSATVLRLARGLAALPLAARGAGLIEPRGAGKVFAVAYPVAVIAYLYAPMAALALEASRANSALLAELAGRGPGLAGAIGNSLLYATATIFISLALGVAASASRALAVGTLSLIAVAPVAYGVAATIAYFKPLAAHMGVDAASRVLIVVAHTAAALPLAGRSLATAWERMPREVVETMLLMGLRGLAFLRHWLAAALPAAMMAAGLAAAASLGEFGASIVVSVPSTWSLTVLVYKLYGAGRYLPEASAVALMLEVLSLTAIAASYTASRRLTR